MVCMAEQQDIRMTRSVQVEALQQFLSHKICSVVAEELSISMSISIPLKSSMDLVCLHLGSYDTESAISRLHLDKLGLSGRHSFIQLLSNVRLESRICYWCEYWFKASQSVSVSSL